MEVTLAPVARRRTPHPRRSAGEFGFPVSTAQWPADLGCMDGKVARFHWLSTWRRLAYFGNSCHVAEDALSAHRTAARDRSAEHVLRNLRVPCSGVRLVAATGCFVWPGKAVTAAARKRAKMAQF